jgi:hypothetical protein
MVMEDFVGKTMESCKLVGMKSAPVEGVLYEKSGTPPNGDANRPCEATNPQEIAPPATSFPSWLSGVRSSSPALFPRRTGFISLSYEPAEEYHLWPETSCSNLKEFGSSPQAYYQRTELKIAPARESEALTFGTLLHSWAELTPPIFWPRVARAPESCLTAAGALSPKAAAKWKADLPPGAIPVSPSDFKKLTDQTAQILANPAAANLLANSIDREFNVRFMWEGHALRSRIDGATEECWYDLKTTRDADPRKSFWSAVRSWGYDLQSAIYQQASYCCGWPEHRLVFIVTSTVWPHHCCVGVLPQRVLARARTRALSLLADLQQRKEWGSWNPADYGQVIEFDCPNFMGED